MKFNPHTNSRSGSSTQGRRPEAGERQRESDEYVQIVDDDQELDDSDLDSIGDLGNSQDDASDADQALDVDDLLASIDARHPTRLTWVLHRASECIRALQAMRSTPCSEWPKDRIPEAQWRSLADEALGLIGTAVKSELNTQKTVEQAPFEERQSMQRYLDTFTGMKLFSNAFEKEREIWERAYWFRSVDESFGKRQWSGPEGWRNGFDQKHIEKSAAVTAAEAAKQLRARA